ARGAPRQRAARALPRGRAGPGRDHGRACQPRLARRREIASGAIADLVTVGLDSPRLAGATRTTALASVVFAASAADVRHVVVGGRDLVADGRHLLIDDVRGALAAAIRPLLGT